MKLRACVDCFIDVNSDLDQDMAPNLIMSSLPADKSLNHLQVALETNVIGVVLSQDRSTAFSSSAIRQNFDTSVVPSMPQDAYELQFCQAISYPSGMHRILSKRNKPHILFM